MIGEKHHVASAKLLATVGIALFLLTLLTTGVHFLHLPQPWSLIAAIAIGMVKACLVAFVFMNLWWSQKFNLMILIASVLFISLLVGISLLDMLFRMPAAHPW